MARRRTKTRLENDCRSPFGYYAARYWGIHIYKTSGEKDVKIRSMIMRLGNSRSRVDPVTQLTVSDRPGAWNDELWHRGKSLLHLLVENGFTDSLTETLKSNAFKVRNIARLC